MAPSWRATVSVHVSTWSSERPSRTSRGIVRSPQGPRRYWPGENSRSHGFGPPFQAEKKAPRERIRARIPLKHMTLQSLSDVKFLRKILP